MERNRITPASRYPACACAALERARTDFDFCRTLGAIIYHRAINDPPMFPSEVVWIYKRAVDVIDELESTEPKEWTV